MLACTATATALGSDAASPASGRAGVRTGAPPIRHQSIRAPRWRLHIAAARRYARHRAGDVGFALIDWWGRLHRFHARRTAPSASVIKVMFLVAYLRLPSVRHHRLHHSDRALLRPMVRRSDDTAASIVAGIVGTRRINRLARAAHMRDFRYSPGIWGLSRISPRDQARFMYRLERYIPRGHRRFALRQLARVVPSQRWGIGRLRLPGWRVCFKGGWGGGTGWVDHQVALIKHGGVRLSLAIFTHLNPSHSYGKRTLRGVAARLLRGLPLRGA